MTTEETLASIQKQLADLQARHDNLERENKILAGKNADLSERGQTLEKLMSTAGKHDYLPGEKNIPMPSEKVKAIASGAAEVRATAQPVRTGWDPAMAKEAGLPAEQADEITRRLAAGEKMDDIKATMGRLSQAPTVVNVVLDPAAVAAAIAAGAKPTIVTPEGTPIAAEATPAPVADLTRTEPSLDTEPPDPELTEAAEAAALSLATA